jgi:hypothetical protein
VEAGEDLGAADVVEADEAADNPDEDAGLAVEPRQGLQVLVERGAVIDVELDGARLVDLVDREPARYRLVEADVIGLGHLGRKERQEREPAERARLTELERKSMRLCLHAS